MPKTKDILINVGILIATVIIMLVLSEIVLHIAFPQKETIEYLEGPFDSRFQEVYGWKHNANSTIRRRSSEFDTIININSDGFYDNEWDQAALRVAALGDSYTLATAVSQELRFTELFENDLESEYESVEVYNFGMGGYATCNEYLVLNETALDFQPDAIFLFVYLGNDFTDNLNEDTSRPRCTVEGTDVSYIPPIPPGETKKDRTFVESFVVRTNIGSLAMNTFRYSPISYKGAKLLGVARNYSTMNLFNTNNIASIQRTINPTNELLLATHALAEENAIPFTVVLIPHRIQVQQNTWDSIIAKYELEGAIYDQNIPNTYVAQFLEENGVPFIDLTPIFRELLEEDPAPLYFAHEGHLNERGHRAVAHVLRDHFETSATV